MGLLDFLGKRSPGLSVEETLMALSKGAVLIDVRTPSEFADGHLEGAINIDIQSAGFTDQISQLPTDGTYFVYCRSGNRSATAVRQMDQLGFTSLTDGGGVGAASQSTGIPVVQGP